MNKVEITGGIYNIKKADTSSGKCISRFGLRIYCGKDKEGKAQHGFINCKYYGDITNDGQLKDITGRLSVDVWKTKDGRTISTPEIIVESINPSEMFSKKKENPIDNLDDIVF